MTVILSDLVSLQAMFTPVGPQGLLCLTGLTRLLVDPEQVPTVVRSSEGMMTWSWTCIRCALLVLCSAKTAATVGLA